MSAGIIDLFEDFGHSTSTNNNNRYKYNNDNKEKSITREISKKSKISAVRGIEAPSTSALSSLYLLFWRDCRVSLTSRPNAWCLYYSEVFDVYIMSESRRTRRRAAPANTFYSDLIALDDESTEGRSSLPFVKSNVDTERIIGVARYTIYLKRLIYVEPWLGISVEENDLCVIKRACIMYNNCSGTAVDVTIWTHVNRQIVCFVFHPNTHYFDWITRNPQFRFLRVSRDTRIRFSSHSTRDFTLNVNGSNA